MLPHRFAVSCGFAVAAIFVAFTWSVAAKTGERPDPAPAAAVGPVRAVSTRLPMRFDPVPTGGHNAFIARGPGYAVKLSSTAITIALHAPSTSHARDAAISMRLIDARAVTGRGIDPLPGVTNHLNGNDPTQWRTGLRGFSKVQFTAIYAGITALYYGSDQALEYDFVVEPGADPRSIAFRIDGARRIGVAEDGALVLETDHGVVRQPQPIAYQAIEGSRRPVDVRFAVRGERVSFRFGRYDRRQPLIIDPVLAYSSYLGGTANDAAMGLAVDADGNMYVAGETASLDFPHTAGEFAGGADAFVAKISAAGDQLLYATYFGGSAADYAKDVAVDAAGNAYVVGTTASRNFPTVNAMRSAPGNVGADGFLTKFDANGAIVYSTYIGGSANDEVNAVAVDAAGRAYVAGQTDSADLPASGGSRGSGVILKTVDGGRTWVDIRGLISSYAMGIAVDPTDPNVLYAGIDHGFAASRDAGTTWRTTSAPWDVFSITSDPALPSAMYFGFSSFLLRTADGGGNFTNAGLSLMVTALAIDPQSPHSKVAATAFAGVWTTTDGLNWANTLTGTVWSVARSASAPSIVYAGTQSGVYKSSNGGLTWAPVGTVGTHTDPGFRAVVNGIAVDPTDPSVAYAASEIGLFKTTSGGTQWTQILPFNLSTVSVSAVEHNRVYCSSRFGGIAASDDGGATWSITNTGQVWTVVADPVVSTTAYASTLRSTDAFMMRISADGTSTEYSTLLGGLGFDSATSIAVDAAGNAFIAGVTQSAAFPTANAAQSVFGGTRDAFIVKIAADGAVVYSTFLGGSGAESRPTVAVDALGRAHVAGYTSSIDFPVVHAQQPAFGGGPTDAFVAALSPSGDALVYSTYLGGGGSEAGAGSFLIGQDPQVAIASMPSGDVYVTGSTDSSDFPVLRAVQPALGGQSDAFVARLSADGLIQWSTFLGGSALDSGMRIAIDRNGSVVAAGITGSTNFPTAHGFQAGKSGANDAFITRLVEDTPDATSPTTSFVFNGLQGNAGWFRSPVSVSLAASDAPGESGVAFVDYRTDGGWFQRYREPFAVEREGSSTIDARATDNSGNVETPLASATVRVDTVAPSLSVTAPGEVDYLHTASFAVQFGAVDDGSGLDVGSPAATLDGVPVFSGQTILALTLPIGTHTVTFSATDVAGNQTQQTRTFRIVATIGSLIDAVNDYTAQGRIERSAANSLLAKLTDAQAAFDRGDLNPVRAKLEDFVNTCSKKLPADVAGVLIGDAQYVLSGL